MDDLSHGEAVCTECLMGMFVKIYSDEVTIAC